MSQLCQRNLDRLDTQGFDSLTQEEIESFYPWQRFAYGLCTAITALGVVLASPPILWCMAVVALTASVQPIHPFDLIYNHGIRRITGSAKLPPRSASGRFACALATVCLVPTAYAFQVNVPIVGYSIGAALVVVGGLVSTIDLCIPSLIWRSAFGFPARRKFHHGDGSGSDQGPGGDQEPAGGSQLH